MWNLIWEYVLRFLFTIRLVCATLLCTHSLWENSLVMVHLTLHLLQVLTTTRPTYCLQTPHLNTTWATTCVLPLKLDCYLYYCMTNVRCCLNTTEQVPNNILLVNSLAGSHCFNISHLSEVLLTVTGDRTTSYLNLLFSSFFHVLQTGRSGDIWKDSCQDLFPGGVHPIA